MKTNGKQNEKQSFIECLLSFSLNDVCPTNSFSGISSIVSLKPSTMRKFLMKLILIASVVIAVSEVKFITNELGIENSVSALSAIVLQFFTRESSIVSFIICTKNNLVAQEFIEKVLLRVGSSISYHIESCDSLRDIKERKFVLLLVDYASTEYLSKQMTSKRFDYSGYYLLYSLNGIDETVMSKVFESFFNLFIYNLNIVTETENVQLTTFYPFTSESCKSTEPVVINEFKNGSWELLEFYPPKTRNFYKCPLKAAAFIYAPAIMMDGSYKSNNYTLRGSDIELLNGFADALNFTVEYIFDPSPGAWGLLKENGEATGAFKKIIDREADLMIGMLSKMYSRSKYISFTSTIVFNPVVVIIPPGAHYNAFEKLFLPFQDAVWIYLLLVFILGCVLVTLLTVNPNNHLKMYIIGREIRMPMLNMIVACVGGSQHVLPVKSAARILLMTFLLFCLIKRTLYTASLFQFLQTENRKPVLSSIEEIMERGFTIYYYPSFDETLKIFKFYKQ